MIPAIVNAVVLPPLLALLVSGAVVAILIRSRASTLALDHPNRRSLHATPTPRLGGIAIAAGIAAAWIYASPPFDARLLIALGVLLVISLIEDLKGVPIAWRLIAHFAAAFLAMTSAFAEQPLWAMLLAILATAWMINLYNFMDGSDGLAGGMAVIGFGSYGLAALTGGDFSFAALNLSVAMAALGFLWFNFPPAKIFMGDAGAIPLGCLAAAFDVLGWQRGAWPVWFGVMIFSPFIVDASYTLFKRAIRRARVWQPHREHLYQRLVQCGWGHRKTALAGYALMFTCSSIAIAGLHLWGMPLAAPGALVLLYAALIPVVERRLSAHA